MRTTAIITSQAGSLVNFRGPLIRELAASGAQIYAFAPDFDDESRQQVRDLGATPVKFPLERTGMNPMRDVVGFWRLARLLRRLKPDVTLAYFIKPVIYGTTAAWVAGVPRRVAMIEGLGYVFTLSSDRLSWRRRLLRAIVNGLYRFALGRAHQVIFLNQDDLSDFVCRGLVKKEKATNLGGIGVDLMEWETTSPVVKPITFLLAARLLREKGILEYAEAARRVKEIHPEVRFLLLGGLDSNPGGLSGDEVRAWVCDGLLEWPGHVPVRPWLAQTSVYVLPSYREGVPRSTQEAMAMGRPVITTDAPGCRETVVEGRNGFLVPVRDPEALAQRMLRFIEQPELIAIMGRASRALAEERFDVNKVNAKMMKWLGVLSRQG